MTDENTTAAESQEPKAQPEPQPAPQPAEETKAGLTQEDMAKELEKVRKEAASYRTKLRAKEEAEAKAAEEKRQAELSAEERAKEAEAKIAKVLAEAEAKEARASRLVSLAGKVTKPERVLKLMDDPERYFPDGNLDEKALLEDFPEYAPTKGPTAPAPTTGAAGTAPRPPVTREDIGKLTPAEYAARRAEILAAQKR